MIFLLFSTSGERTPRDGACPVMMAQTVTGDEENVLLCINFCFHGSTYSKIKARRYIPHNLWSCFSRNISFWLLRRGSACAPMHDYVTSSIILVRTKSRNFREFSFRQLCVGMYELAVQFRSLGESSFVPSVLLLSRHQLQTAAVIVTRHGATRGR